MEIQQRLKGTQQSNIIHELLMNTLHFPLLIIVLELLIETPAEYFKEPDFYIIIIACFIQAYLLGSWRYQAKSHYFLGNLIAPSIYTITEFWFEGLLFFSSPHHIAYWLFALSIGLIQAIKDKKSGLSFNLLTILEHFIRTCMLLVMYAIFEALIEPKYTSIEVFLANDSHLFISIVIPLLGLVIGFNNVITNHYLSLLQQTAEQLKKYSEWLLGKTLLSSAINDDNHLALHKQQRSLLFMDIRGFTHWSEQHPPENVVNMLNAYFEKAEQIWSTVNIIKIKYTADEIMAVFEDSQSSVENALILNQEINLFLKQYDLSVGIGVHQGTLIEGLIGSKDIKMYDIIGDTVNTAKRICDHAQGGEVLISQAVYAELSQHIEVSEAKLLTVKGKSQPLKVFPLKI
jgi:class 3 adenylate cyclase